MDRAIFAGHGGAIHFLDAGLPAEAEEMDAVVWMKSTSSAIQRRQGGGRRSACQWLRPERRRGPSRMARRPRRINLDASGRARGKCRKAYDSRPAYPHRSWPDCAGGFRMRGTFKGPAAAFGDQAPARFCSRCARGDGGVARTPQKIFQQGSLCRRRGAPGGRGVRVRDCSRIAAN